MRYEFIDGDTHLINRLIKDGWEIVNTFPNPYPQPYFFALVRLNTMDEEAYKLEEVVESVREIRREAERKAHAEIPF